MNVNSLFQGLQPLEQKTSTMRASNLTENSFRSIFPAFFSQLSLNERKTLKAIGKYEYLTGVYDRLNSGIAFSKHEINEIKNLFNSISNLRAQFQNNGLARPSIINNAILNVTFPIQVQKSSSDSIKDNVDWFFDGIQKSLMIFEELESNELTLLNIENELLSISVAVDWKMVLVIAWLLREFKANSQTIKSDEKSVRHLKERGLKESTIKLVKDELEISNNDSETNTLIQKLDELLSSLKDVKLAKNWESTARLLIQRIRTALQRGFKIETEIKDIQKLETQVVSERVIEVKKIVQYDRNIDDDDITGERLKIEQK